MEESGTVEDAATAAESSSSAEGSVKITDPLRIISSVAADVSDVTESGSIGTNSPVDDAVDETMSEAEVEDLLLEPEIKEPEWRGTRRLVIKDTFHSYVRPVWQPKLTTFCSSLTGISQVSRWFPLEVASLTMGSLQSIGDRRQVAHISGDDPEAGTLAQ